MEVLLKGILGNTNIFSVEIANNRLQERGVRALCSFFERPRMQLQALRLSGNKALVSHTDELCAGISGYRGLKELKLNDFKLSKEACESLSYVVLGNLNLQQLDLSWNQIQTRDLLLITEALAENKSLNYLSFRSVTV